MSRLSRPCQSSLSYVLSCSIKAIRELTWKQFYNSRYLFLIKKKWLIFKRGKGIYLMIELMLNISISITAIFAKKEVCCCFLSTSEGCRFYRSPRQYPRPWPLTEKERKQYILGLFILEHIIINLPEWLFARKCIFHIYFPEVWALCRYYIWSKQIATFQSSDSTQNRPPPGERWYRLIKTRLERAHKFGIPSGGFLAARWINVANCNCRGNFASAWLVLLAPPTPPIN